MLDNVIDLSHWNTTDETSFAQVAASGIVGCIHKASEGIGFTDGAYALRLPKALDAGLLWGAYHFGRSGDAVGQAHYFLDQVQPTRETLLVLDWEPVVDAPAMTLAEAEEFVLEIALQVGRFPGLYSPMDFCHTQLATCHETILSECWLWMARVSTEPPEVPVFWPTWSLWQYTHDGSVPGIVGPCDRNIWNGDMAGLYRLWGVESPGTA